MMQREITKLGEIVDSIDVERMLDNAATCSQSRELLEVETRQCLELNLVKPLALAVAKAVVEECAQRVGDMYGRLPHPKDRTAFAEGEAEAYQAIAHDLSALAKGIE